MITMLMLCGVLCPTGKSAAFLRVVRCRSLAEEYSMDTFNKDEISTSSLSACSLSQFINVMATDCLEGFTNMIYCCVYPCLGVAVCV